MNKCLNAKTRWLRNAEKKDDHPKVLLNADKKNFPFYTTLTDTC
jgi:hypothetical protein